MMKRILRHLALCAIGLWLATGWHAPAFAQTSNDSYNAMLTYLDSSAIDGNVMQNTQGVTGVNQATGNGNLQGNLRAFAVSNQAQALIQAQQHAHAYAPNATLYASATIGGHAYDNAQGIASINQVSGNSNTQLNGVAAALTNKAYARRRTAPCRPPSLRRQGGNLRRTHMLRPAARGAWE
jgi:hypothetical protein